MTVNQRVSGSSPEGGAGNPRTVLFVGFFMPETAVITSIYSPYRLQLPLKPDFHGKEQHNNTLLAT